MKQTKIISRVFLLILFLAGCQSVKDGISGKRINQGEEFLIEKKNPLVVPPDFEYLPQPASVNNENDETEEGLSDFEKLLGKKDNKNSTKNDNSNTSTEKSILKKIKTI